MIEWYVAKSKPQKEAWLTTSLSSLGVEVFYPRMISNRRGKRTLDALFPTYVFCKFDINSPAFWHAGVACDTLGAGPKLLPWNRWPSDADP